jgi:hypothetical protein
VVKKVKEGFATETQRHRDRMKKLKIESRKEKAAEILGKAN